MGYLCSCCTSCCCGCCCNCKGYACVVILSVFGLLFDLIGAALMMQPITFEGTFGPDMSMKQAFTWGVLGPVGGVVCFSLIILFLTLDRFCFGNKYAAKEEPGIKMTDMSAVANRA